MDDASEALKSNKLFEGKRLRVERAKVNRTLFIAKLNRNTTNSVISSLPHCHLSISLQISFSTLLKFYIRY